MNWRDIPGDPVVKSLPSNAGDTGSIPGQGTKIPHAVGQLSLCATTREACVQHGEDLAQLKSKIKLKKENELENPAATEL